jgi:tricorn protease-like protein
VLDKVGESGCGVVYVAEQTEPVRRRGALKVIKPGMDTKQVVARFEAERQALANYNGRGVNIYDLASGRRLYSLPDDLGSIWWLAWHPDGRHLAVARDNGGVSLWNLTEMEALLAKVGLAP